MASVVRAVAVLKVLCCLSGCEDYGTPGMTIANETSEPVHVIYRRQDRPRTSSTTWLPKSEQARAKPSSASTRRKPLVCVAHS